MNMIEEVKAGRKRAREQNGKTLLVRLGGAEAVAAVVDEFYERVLADDMVGRFFKAKSMPHQRKMLGDFLVQAFGGGPVYTGRTLSDAHAKMRITHEHFGRVAKHLSAALEHLRVAPELVDEVMTAVAGLADQVITQPSATEGRQAGAGRAGGSALLGEVSGLRGIMDSLQTNVFVANTELHIVYINRKGTETLRTLEKPIQEAFGVRIEDIVNGHIHRFHRDPKRVEDILRSPGYLPHSTSFNFAGITLQTNIDAVYDESRNVIGYTVCWEDVTDELIQKNEIQRLTNMVEQMPTNVFLCDRDLTITYLNPAAFKMMSRLEPYINVKADALVGTNIDVFHKHPEHQRRVMADPRKLPHRALITIGPEKMDLLVSAIYDARGEYVGPMMTWELVTERVNQQALVEGRIHETIRTLAASSEELISTSAQMSSSAEESSNQANSVASAAEQINRSVQAVSGGIEEMNASIKEIAKNANDAARIADEAVRIAESTNGTVGDLGMSSAEIGKVIKVITGIAQQTNLLALNATIEAARAGDAGRGFAVVANEVKELAKETARATEDIGQKIEAIQGGVRGAVEGIARISEVINHISQVQGSIASAVEEQTVTSTEISRRVFEAAKGTDDIARSVTGVATTARSTSDGAASTRSSAAELARMASELQELTSARKD